MIRQASRCCRASLLPPAHFVLDPQRLDRPAKLCNFEEEGSSRAVNWKASELLEPKSFRGANVGPIGRSSRLGAAPAGTKAGWMPPSRRRMVRTSSCHEYGCPTSEVLMLIVAHFRHRKRPR